MGDLRILRLFTVFAALCFGTAGWSNPICAPLSVAAEDLGLIYLDIADPEAARVSLPLESDLLRQQIAGESPGPTQKLYCDIGLFDLHLRFVVPVEDDAILAIVTEAKYVWDPEQDPAGWMLNSLKRQPACARGDEPFADLCP